MRENLEKHVEVGNFRHSIRPRTVGLCAKISRKPNLVRVNI
jgi:hypothetical protein